MASYVKFLLTKFFKKWEYNLDVKRLSVSDEKLAKETIRKLKTNLKRDNKDNLSTEYLNGILIR